MLGPLARIIVRYGAGALVAAGLLTPTFGEQLAADADVISMAQVGLGFSAMIAVEGYYFLAKRFGWST